MHRMPQDLPAARASLKYAQIKQVSGLSSGSIFVMAKILPFNQSNPIKALLTQLQSQHAETPMDGLFVAHLQGDEIHFYAVEMSTYEAIGVAEICLQRMKS